MKPCFLDTCAVLHVLQDHKSALQAISGYKGILISHVVLGELIFGCRRSEHPERERSRISAWLSSISVINPTRETCEVYGELAADLEARGQRIPQNDMWIAALCIQSDLPLISSDNHFSRPRGLNWISY
jgi:tRNA(fMet)-specific endonuclease VapC